MGILGSAKPIMIICTQDEARAAAFYRETLGLSQTGEDRFAAIFEVDGVPLRVSFVADFTPHTHTVLDFNVRNLPSVVRALRDKGVTFNIYPGFAQDELGILAVPGTSMRVAWFNDPDGNVLSVMEDHSDS